MGNQTGKQGIVYTNLVGPNGTLIPIQTPPPRDLSHGAPQESGETLETPSDLVADPLPSQKDEIKGDDEGNQPEVKNLPPHCFLCQKKLGPISQFKCRCENIYCSKHLHSFNHACKFDYKKLQQEKLIKENPRIKSQWNTGTPR